MWRSFFASGLIVLTCSMELALPLGSTDYGDGHFTCFQFDYDWRRDNVEDAKRLNRITPVA